MGKNVEQLNRAKQNGGGGKTAASIGAHVLSPLEDSTGVKKKKRGGNHYLYCQGRDLMEKCLIPRELTQNRRIYEKTNGKGAFQKSLRIDTECTSTENALGGGGRATEVLLERD